MATLPVSMDDEELFPRHRHVATFKLPHVLVDRRRYSPTASEHSSGSSNGDLPEEAVIVREMREKLSLLWWSRLLIATRGYLCSFYAEDQENTLFCFDDAFIYLHRKMVEADADTCVECVKDLLTLRNVRLELLAELAAGYQLGEEEHPFYAKSTRRTFRHLFGQPTPQVFYRAYKQTVAFYAFTDVLRTLIRRYAEQDKHRKGVRFVEDTEWQPDDRVVIFQEFYKGNRTWVLLDFDRHILNYHRPNGVRAIFGDRYVQMKRDEGCLLCANCGMIEQMPRQFPICPQCQAENRQNPASYCSSECLNANIRQHAEKYHS